MKPHSKAVYALLASGWLLALGAMAAFRTRMFLAVALLIVLVFAGYMVYSTVILLGGPGDKDKKKGTREERFDDE